jgi:hypothetical protein
MNLCYKLLHIGFLVLCVYDNILDYCNLSHVSNQLFEILFLIHVSGSKQLAFGSIISIFGVKNAFENKISIMPTNNPTCHVLKIILLYLKYA